MLPAIYESIHIVYFEGGDIEFIKSKDHDELKKKLNTERTVSFGDTTYASRLYIKSEKFVTKDGLEAYISTLDRDLRKRLSFEMKKYQDTLGKKMSLQSAQCYVEAWKKENDKSACNS